MPLPRLRAGDLKHRITIKRKEMAPDNLGGFETTWPVLARPWAEVIGLDGREAVIAQSLQGISAYRIRIRFRTSIRPGQTDCQISYGDLDLNVRSIADPNGDREQLVIMADTGSAEQTQP